MSASPDSPDTPDDEAQARLVEDRKLIETLAYVGALIDEGDGDDVKHATLALIADPTELLHVLSVICREVMRNGCDVVTLAENGKVASAGLTAAGAMMGGMLGIKGTDPDPEPEIAGLWTAGERYRQAVFGAAS